MLILVLLRFWSWSRLEAQRGFLPSIQESPSVGPFVDSAMFSFPFEMWSPVSMVTGFKIKVFDVASPPSNGLQCRYRVHFSSIKLISSAHYRNPKISHYYYFYFFCSCDFKLMFLWYRCNKIVFSWSPGFFCVLNITFCFYCSGGKSLAQFCGIVDEQINF